MIKQTLKLAGLFDAVKGLKQYTVEDESGELIATVVQKTQDANIHQVLWYGGDRHGKSDLTEGGVEGLMEFIGETV
jgi:hypothetical protein